MQENNPSQPIADQTTEPTSASFGNLPNHSENFGSVPNGSEDFRSLPNASATFRKVTKLAERTASHTLTVREAAKLFEAVGVARTERSIVTWCQPNPHGVARLDAYFDLNDRRWFITPESVERAIAEEQAKAARHNEPLPKSAEETLPNASEPRSKRKPTYDQPEDGIELNAKLRDLEIANRVKDSVILKLEKNLQSADEERQ